MDRSIVCLTLLLSCLIPRLLGDCPTNCKIGQICNDADSGCPDCDSSYYGRKCEHPYECKRSAQGLGYRGYKSTTENGRTCQDWSLDTPHSHPYNYVVGQYCRNPDNFYRLWCYTTNPRDRYYTCYIPDCDDQCPAPDLIPFGDVIDPPATGFVVNIIVEIKGGCGLGTKGKSTCLDTKTWSAVTNCTTIKWCTKPQLNTNSNVQNIQEDYYYNDSITVFCDTGYEMSGEASIQCQANSLWGVLPTCNVVQCPTPTLKPQSYITNSKSTYIYQYTITVSCNFGFNVQGNNTFTCQADKSWDGEMPTCQRVPCQDPKALLNPESYIENYKTFYVYQDEINVRCNSGYTIQGSSRITCLGSGSWNSQMPTCQPVPCSKPTNLPQKTFIENPKDTYVFKDTIVLFCEKGYSIKGGNKINCLADQTWGTIPACTVVECPSPKLPANAVITLGQKSPYVYLDVVTIRCNTGFILNGNNETTCLHTGRWHLVSWSCKVVTCPKPKIPSHAVIKSQKKKSFIYQDEIVIKCESGYSLTGGSTSSCLASGDWKKASWHCKEDGGNQMALYIGSAVGGLAGVAIIVGIVVFFVRRKSKRKDSKYCHKVLEENQGLPTAAENVYANSNNAAVHSSNVYVNVKAIQQDSKGIQNEAVDAIYYNTIPQAKKSSDYAIKIDKLADFIKEKEIEKTYFQDQFALLKPGLQRPTNEACMPHNKEKNKYKNIYPYDDNRVVLSKSQESDYVNASPIIGYQGKVHYVAAQGPIQKSLNDFWRMIWELKSGAIVMLTNLFEDGKKKCEQYWPDERSITYGDISVNLCDTDVYAEFTIRQLSVSKGNSTRMIHQFHFTAWPDKSVPKFTSSLAHFRRKVMGIPSSKDGPIVVHCSAGIGRTGTFIALDYLVNEFKSTGSVDVFPCLQKLREQRVNMVQTKDQYAYLHSVLVEEYECEHSTIIASEFLRKFEKLKKTNPETGRCYIEDEFNELEKTSPIVNESDIKVGKLAVNKTKNRYNNILPVDGYRPFIMGEGDNNYINAVYLPGYRNNKAFIVTQMPLPDTVIDFLTLVLEQDVTKIVMLNELGDKSSKQYWPEPGKTVTFGKFEVVSIGVKEKENMQTHTLKLNYEKEFRVIKQYRVSGWPDSSIVPSSPSLLLNVMENIQTGVTEAPVLIHCMNGSDKSGLLCTILGIIDRMKVEHNVVIQQVIKQMRCRRPQIIPNMEQFHFCYEAVCTYLQAFETYCNFS